MGVLGYLEFEYLLKGKWGKEKEEKLFHIMQVQGLRVKRLGSGFKVGRHETSRTPEISSISLRDSELPTAMLG